jgi:hypothetical protein
MTGYLQAHDFLEVVSEPFPGPIPVTALNPIEGDKTTADIISERK